MSRQVYQLNSANVEYTRVGPMEFEFYARPRLARRFRRFRNRDKDIIVQGSKTGFRVVDFRRVKDAPPQGTGQNRKIKFFMKLEKLA